MSEPPLDAAGRRRPSARCRSFHAGRPPRKKGCATRPTQSATEEIVAVMRRAGDTRTVADRAA
jgi:hypothetical protein